MIINESKYRNFLNFWVIIVILTNENSRALRVFLITHIYDGNVFAISFDEKSRFENLPTLKKKFSTNKTEQ